MDLPPPRPGDTRPPAFGSALGLLRPATMGGADIVEELVRLGGCVGGAGGAPGRRVSRGDFRERLVKVWPHLLYSLYSRAGPPPPCAGAVDPLCPHRRPARLEGCRVLRIRPRRPGTVTSSEECGRGDDAVSSPRRALALGFRIIKGRALEIARFGVWSYHHARHLINVEARPPSGRSCSGQPATGSVLPDPDRGAPTREGDSHRRGPERMRDRSGDPRANTIASPPPSVRCGSCASLHDEGPRARCGTAGGGGGLVRLQRAAWFTTPAIRRWPGFSSFRGPLPPRQGLLLAGTRSMDRRLPSADPPAGKKECPPDLYRFAPAAAPGSVLGRFPFPVGGRRPPLPLRRGVDVSPREGAHLVLEIAADGPVVRVRPSPCWQRQYTCLPLVVRWTPSGTWSRRRRDPHRGAVRASVFPYDGTRSRAAVGRAGGGCDGWPRGRGAVVDVRERGVAGPPPSTSSISSTRHSAGPLAAARRKP
jgi:hypothetical protein